MKHEKREELELARKPSETANPFQMMRRFSKDMERLFEDFHGFNFPAFFRRDFVPFRMELEKVGWIPRIEMLENNGNFIVRVDLPGMTKDMVKVEVTNDLLTISGERKEETEDKHEGFYRTERSYGNFFRQIPLPEGAKTENATATFAHGVLEVTIPAVKIEPSIRKLEIKEPIVAKAKGATA
jgi:HSP20 family protein